MTGYCFRCPECFRSSVRGELPVPGEKLLCGPCLGQDLEGKQVELQRDYQAEGVNVGKIA